MWSDWWLIPVSIVIALGVTWLLLAVAVWLAKPQELAVHDVVRLLPDVLRLLKRLASDRDMPRRIRIVLLLLVAFVVSPIDVIPDFIPVIGFADDVIIIAVVLRWLVRSAGPAPLATHWPGSPDGLGALCRLCGLPQPE
jgi:uncharacterized membrane protein YkvA (DUF1232 family)